MTITTLHGEDVHFARLAWMARYCTLRQGCSTRECLFCHGLASSAAITLASSSRLTAPEHAGPTAITARRIKYGGSTSTSASAVCTRRPGRYCLPFCYTLPAQSSPWCPIQRLTPRRAARLDMRLQYQHARVWTLRLPKRQGDIETRMLTRCGARLSTRSVR